MKAPIKTVAIVVTHNRRELLRRCIGYLKEQTMPVEKIVVINNGSIDGTSEMLKEMDVFCIDQENVGSAGGWQRGLSYAMANDFDAAWLMDDDGYPDQQSHLLLANELRANTACISSVVVEEDRPSTFVFPFPVLNKNGLPAIFTFPRKIKTINALRKFTNADKYPFVHLFNGALISIKAVHHIGNINEDYFIYGDEVDYFFRLRCYGEVVSLLSAYHYHPNVSKRSYTVPKIYYLIKNSLIINKKYFDIICIRNILTIIVISIRTAKRNSLHMVFSLLFGRYKQIFYSAIIKGLKGQLGKDFNG